MGLVSEPSVGRRWLIAPRGGAADVTAPRPFRALPPRGAVKALLHAKGVSRTARTSGEGGVKERNEGITGRSSLGNRGATGPVRGSVAVIERAV